MTKRIDRCLARGCGGSLTGADFGEFSDGTVVHCASCGRLHWLHVDEHGAVWSSIERARDWRRRQREEGEADHDTRRSA